MVFFALSIFKIMKNNFSSSINKLDQTLLIEPVILRSITTVKMDVFFTCSIISLIVIYLFLKSKFFILNIKEEILAEI
jgi:hypothetical protein